MPKLKVGIISLGCCRNLVDSQILVGRLKDKGYVLTHIQKADIGILNTCAFIKEAKEESLETIQELADLKKNGRLKKLIVTGCLPQRYHRELVKHLDGIDAFVGRLALEDRLVFEQQLLTPGHFAYVKICESCFNQCSYCVIPRIKGKFKSRSADSIIHEAKSLDSKGIKELNLVGQDTTAYGRDLSGGIGLAGLLPKIIAATKNI
ncbi:MAG: radical SAM protein, partial [Candidatus Omnitrophota bacterium]